ncbi:hypothetical protein TNCV_1097031 [Trichonephila clavipes]|nr:hypothetical protein TNCV_1097031 [Trichonephila clavipes]
MTPNPDSLNKKHLAIQNTPKVLAFYNLMRSRETISIGSNVVHRVDSIGPERLFSLNERTLAERTKLDIPEKKEDDDSIPFPIFFTKLKRQSWAQTIF